MAEKRSQVLQKRPFAPLYFLAKWFYMGLICRHKFNLVVSGDRVRGPALVLSNHASNHDYKFVAYAVRPALVSFLVTYHFFTFRKLAFWLKLMGAIPKYQFATDLEAMRKIQYVIRKQKGTVWIAPEARSTPADILDTSRLQSRRW